MTVLVLDGGERSSLTMVRSLGRKNIEVHTGEHYGFNLSALSKYCKDNVTYPDPQVSMEMFIEGLLEILESSDYEMLLSSREVTTIPIIYKKRKLERYATVPFPQPEKVEYTIDKLKTFKLAERVGIPIPKTYYANDLDELMDIKDQVNFPIVVKPRSKTTWVNGTPVMLKVTGRNYVRSAEEMVRISTEIFKKTGKMPLIQEYVPGTGYGVEVLFNRGTPRAIFMHRRLREYPITGGASTFRESVYREDLKEYALKLMEALNWHGVAMVEFKIDSRDDTPKLMEINGRFWGSLALSVAAGVDFPYLLYKMFTDGDVEPVWKYKLGVKCRWLLPGDILWFISSLKCSASKLKVLKEFLKFRHTCYDILSRDDPLPMIGAFGTIISYSWDVVTGRRNIHGEVVKKGLGGAKK